eukprot:scaffold11566_cov97-Skeletonema_dohrnii-CCMP3373.AAC.2
MSLSPSHIAQSLTTTDFFGGDVKEDILPQVKRALDPFGYDVALMTARVTGLSHPHYRGIKNDKRGSTMIRIYCARCSTHCKNTLAQSGNNFRCAVIGVLTVHNLPTDYCLGNDLPEHTKSATLSKLYPHPTECLSNRPDHMLKHVMSSFESGPGFVKLPINLDAVIGPLFDNILQQFKQLTKGHIQVNQDNDTGKKIDSFAKNDIRIMVRCDDVDSPDSVQQSINHKYGIDKPEFQREFQMVMRRLTLFLANHFNIADECTFLLTHSTDNIISPPGDGRLHPAVGRLEQQHMKLKKCALLIGGWSRSNLPPVHQVPHTDYGVSEDGFEVHNNPRLTSCCKPMSIIIPLVDPRRIVMYQEYNGQITQKVLQTDVGEVMIVDAGCVHGGYTYLDTTPRWKALPHVYPVLHVYFFSDRHICDTKELTISSYHVMNHQNLAGYIPNVTQENRSSEAKDAAKQLLRMLPHLEDNKNEKNKQNKECLEQCLEQFVGDLL